MVLGEVRTVKARIGLVVTSDRVYRGEREDRILPLVAGWAERNGYLLAYYTVRPNSVEAIRSAIVEAATWADIVLVTGGTGPGPRDVSVEAARMVAEKELPGLGEEMRRRSRESVGLRAALSRSSAYTLGSSIIIVTPGSPDAVEVALEIVGAVGEHAVRAARGVSHWEWKH